MMTIKVYSWGQSMYGGWYANYINLNTEADGVHFRTLKELRSWAKEYGTELKQENRLDN